MLAENLKIGHDRFLPHLLHSSYTAVTSFGVRRVLLRNLFKSRIFSLIRYLESRGFNASIRGNVGNLLFQLVVYWRISPLSCLFGSVSHLQRHMPTFPPELCLLWMNESSNDLLLSNGGISVNHHDDDLQGEIFAITLYRRLLSDNMALPYDRLGHYSQQLWKLLVTTDFSKIQRAAGRIISLSSRFRQFNACTDFKILSSASFSYRFLRGFII